MAATNQDPLWINASAGAPSYTANELRAAHALALQYGGSGTSRLVGARQGVRPGGDQLKVTYSAPTITVQPGVACVDPGLTSTQGPYWVAVTSTDTFTLTAADATNPRKDIIVLRVYDHDEDASGNRFARTEYLVGTPAASPAEPAVPAGAIKLALLDVPASPGAVVVSDRRVSCFAGPEMAVFNVGVGSFVKADFPWARRIKVRIQAGGGAGGGCELTSASQAAEGSGGGGGGYTEEWLDVWALGASETVTVGAGGTAVSGAAGGNGANTSFGSFCTANGGTGGGLGVATTGTASVAGGNGASHSGGAFARTGGDGGMGRVISVKPVMAAYGGDSMLGGVQRANSATSADGLAGGIYGAGGSGAHNDVSQSARPGGGGADGLCIVEIF